MSVIEEIQFLHRFDPETYLGILERERGATRHPLQPNAYMMDGLPFYKPVQADGYVFVMGFNYTPLPGILIEALASHPELVPDQVAVIWTVEQEQYLEITMAEVRSKLAAIETPK